MKNLELPCYKKNVSINKIQKSPHDAYYRLKYWLETNLISKNRSSERNFLIFRYLGGGRVEEIKTDKKYIAERRLKFV